MVAPRHTPALPQQRGSSMIEVLVTLVIVSFGLLGLAGLQSRLQTSEMESYQRSQALLLLSDMANRIATNRSNAAAYASGATVTSPLGAGVICPTSTASVVETDLNQWCNALQGDGETAGGNKVGAMVGGRGCVEAVGSNYLITVAWQGLTPISAPPVGVACGAGLYNTGGSSCISDRCRRTVTTLVRIATLS